ncbi:MAG TPA: DUF2341 domain-containing protein, partial [Thermoplasmatales archaeon]|nr:DUF2341 domain-containing protein [Thermoplasmatales archaeon]
KRKGKAIWSGNSNYDLQFLEIRCGNKTLNYSWINSSVFIANYSCNETGYEISKVLTTGKHTLQFRFGSDTEYAHNLVGSSGLNVTTLTFYRDSYSKEDWFFTRNETIYIEACVKANGSNVTTANVTANITSNGSEVTTLNLTHYSGCLYRGNWISNSTSAVGVYLVNATAVNDTNSGWRTREFHLYSGENVSAYHMDYNGDGVNESIMENKHLIVVFNETDNTDKLVLYLEQKDTNVSYTFGSISDSNATYRGGVSFNNNPLAFNLDLPVSGENLASARISSVNGLKISWWNSSWPYRRNITVVNNNGTEDLSNHQVLVVLNTSNFDYVRANSDGNDTRFTYYNSTSQNETLIPYWIEQWDTTGQSRIWVNVPYVPAGGTATIYLYYGNSGATSESDASNVFDWTLNGNFAVCTATNTQSYPEVAFGNNNFFVAWHDYRSEANWDVYAKMYNHTGGLFKDEFVISNAANDQTYPWIAFGGDKFFITFDDYRNSNWDYYAEMDNDTGDVFIDDFAVTTNEFPQGFGSTAFGEDRFFTVWYDKRTGDNTKYTVFAEIYNTTGNVTKDEFQISNESVLRTFSSIAFGAGKFFIAWQYENASGRKIRAKTYNSSGDVINDTFNVNTTTHDKIRPSVAFGDNRFFVTWIDNSTGDYHVYGKIYDQDVNVVKDTFTITTNCSYTSETPIEIYPSISFGNGKFFITWHNGSSGDNNILAKIYDINGNVVKNEFEVSTATNDQETPSVAFGNGRFFITWYDERNGNWDIYADLFKDSKYISPEPTTSIGAEETVLDINITLRTGDVDYLTYKINNFIGEETIFSDIAGTLGSSVTDDRYHLENGSDGLVTDLTKDQWNSYTNSNYSLIYDNSTSGDSVNDNVIAWIRFNETENIIFQDIGLWNSSSEALRVRYNTSSATETDEVNYILAFTKGDYSTIDQWMYKIESGKYPTINFMTAPQAPAVILNSPGNATYINKNYTLLNWTCTDPDGDNMTAYVYGDNSTATTLINTITNCQNGSSYTFNWTGLNETTYYWKVNCTDSGGFSNVSDVYEFTVDTTPPNITIINPENQSNLSAGTTWTWINITTDENAVCRYNLTNSSFDYSQGVNFTNTGG